MTRQLVICAGNVARGDDGVAHEVARLLSARRPELDVVGVHALDVALAEPISAATDVIVVDAVRRESPLVSVEDVEPQAISPGEHGSTPGGLLALAQTLYGASPRMQLLGVAAPEMAHGVGLSQIAEQAAREAVEAVLELLG